MAEQTQSGTGDRFTYAFKFLARSEPHGGDNEPSVTISVSAGRDEHVVYCGTLTMSVAEWAALRDHLQGGTSDAVEVDISSELGGPAGG